MLSFVGGAGHVIAAIVHLCRTTDDLLHLQGGLRGQICPVHQGAKLLREEFVPSPQAVHGRPPGMFTLLCRNIPITQWFKALGSRLQSWVRVNPLLSPYSPAGTCSSSASHVLSVSRVFLRGPLRRISVNARLHIQCCLVLCRGGCYGGPLQ